MKKYSLRIRALLSGLRLKWVWLAGLGLAAGVILGVLLLAWQPVELAAPKSVLAQSVKPVNNWFVCADLGIGSVPGVPDARQRFRLCHNDGWQVQTYCLQPQLPAPEIGTVCTRVSETRYACGRGFQEVLEYLALQTPAPAPTATPTLTATAIPPTPAATGTPAPTAIASLVPPTAWIRNLPGGPAVFNWRGALNQARATATPFQPVRATRTPFQPLQPTASAAPPIEPADIPQPYQFAGADFEPGAARLQLRVYPQVRDFNQGRPVRLSFLPGSTCSFGDQRGCVNAFAPAEGGQVVFASLHSGVGGEGQPLRQALEGTFLVQAAWRLPRVQRNLGALTGAEVVITQGEWEGSDFQVVGAARLPSKAVQDYLHTPLPNVLDLVVHYNPHLRDRVQAGRPMLVIETCGWRLPGEAPGRGTTPTSASIYLLLVQPAS